MLLMLLRFSFCFQCTTRFQAPGATTASSFNHARTQIRTTKTQSVNFRNKAELIIRAPSFITIRKQTPEEQISSTRRLPGRVLFRLLSKMPADLYANLASKITPATDRPWHTLPYESPIAQHIGVHVVERKTCRL